VAIDSHGRVFVADRSNNRIQIFDQDGNFVDQWKQFGGDSSITILPDDTLYAVDTYKYKAVFVGSARDGKVIGKHTDLVHSRRTGGRSSNSNAVHCRGALGQDWRYTDWLDGPQAGETERQLHRQLVYSGSVEENSYDSILNGHLYR
jgi:hypothetical protein